MEVILELMPWIWAVIFVATLFIEFKTSDIDAIWFSIGSLVVLIVDLLFPKLALVYQILIFVTTTIALLLTIGKLIKKRFRNKNITNNSDSLVGQEIMIIDNCNEFEKGTGTINGIIWTTICQSGHSLAKGESGIIVAIEGNKLIVKSKI